jgi:hypothetical protein
MLKSSDTGLRPVPFPIEDPERIPSQRYYDPELYRMEVEHLWPHVWQMACRLEQIAEEGDWIEYSNLGKSVIIVNTGAGGIKAWHNACRHRGVPIARQDYSNIPIQQMGMHAQGFEFMRLSKDVECLVSNYQRIIDGYLAGRPQDKLAKATHLLTNNFDAEIKDRGF